MERICGLNDQKHLKNDKATSYFKINNNFNTALSVVRKAEDSKVLVFGWDREHLRKFGGKCKKTSMEFLRPNNNMLESRSNYYENKFIELEELGEGGFGTVFKVEDNRRLSAVKKILLKENNDIEKVKREVNILKKCRGHFVVKYFDSWLENNNCLFIQMELCSDNLKNIITQKSRCFGREQSDAMTPMEYFISSQLFKELLECVQFLHESNPPIIHRDIKPQNILITEEKKNNRFLKICDFGLATEHDVNVSSMSYTRGIGTHNYMAPEVNQAIDGKSRYSTKADVYSLSIILQELFDYNIDSPNKIMTNHTHLKSKWNELKKVILSMSIREYTERPNCTQILMNSHLWSITVDELKNSADYRTNIEQMKNYTNLFFYEFFKKKQVA